MTKLCKPKWQEAFETLSYEIDAGVFQPGDPFYSIKDVSDRFAFSNITARRVFDELKVCRRIRSRRRRNALVLGPVSGDSPAEQVKPETVFLCFQSFGGRFDAAKHPRHTPHIYHGILRGFDRPPFDRLYRIEPISIDFCLSHLDVFAGAGVLMNQEVLLTSGDAPHIDSERVRLIREHLNPVIFQVLVPQSGMTEVRVDKAYGIRQMVDCLVVAGHERIGYLGSSPVRIWSGSSFQGYLQGLTAHDQVFNPAWIGVTSGNDHDQVGEAIDRMLSASPPPTAVVCGNDERALTVLAWCREHNIRVPEDLAVTGYGNTPESKLCRPPLTTVEPRADEMAFAALDLLRRRQAGTLDEPVKITIAPRSVRRASHGSIAGGNASPRRLPLNPTHGWHRGNQKFESINT